MTEASRYFVTIGADVAGAVRGLAQVKSGVGSLHKETRTATGVWGGFTGGLAKTGLVVFGIRQVADAARMAAGALKSMTMASAAEAAGQARLERAVANTGQALGVDGVAAMNKYLDAAEQSSHFSRGELADALTVLVAETGSLSEAQKRLNDVRDVGYGTGTNLVTLAKMMGRYDDESIAGMKALVPQLFKASGGWSAVGAAQQLVAKTGMDMGRALAIANDSAGRSLLLVHGIKPKDMFPENVGPSAKELHDAVQTAYGGLDTLAPDNAADQAALLQKQWHNLAKMFGDFVTPAFLGVTQFGQRAVSGLRHSVALFATDFQGQRITSARALWKSMFGTEMPEALGKVVDMFVSIGDRIGTFVDDLNSEDDKSARGAVKKLAKDLPEILGTGLADIGKEFDKLGVAGIGAKLALVAFTSAPVTSGLLGVGADIAGIVKDLVLIGVAAGTSTGLVVGAMALVGIAVWQVADTVGLLAEHWEDVRTASHDGSLAGQGELGHLLDLAVQAGDAFSGLGTSVHDALGKVDISGIAGALGQVMTFAMQTASQVWSIGSSLIRNIPMVGGLFDAVGWLWDRARDIAGWLGSAASSAGGGGSVGIWGSPDLNGGAAAAAAGGSLLQRQVTVGFGPRAGQEATQQFLTGEGAPAMWGGVPNIDHIIMQLPDVPRMAAGGVATRPTLAMVGDAGPEAIIPLSRWGGRGGGGGDVNFHAGAIVIHGDVDSTERVRELSRQIVRDLGLSGARF